MPVLSNMGARIPAHAADAPHRGFWASALCLLTHACAPSRLGVSHTSRAPLLDGAGVRHPLKAASYTSLTANLEREGWSAELLAAGFDPAVPSVWIAEGLVMYLSEDAVGNLLREARKVSAGGSRLLVMVRRPCRLAP